MHDAGNDKGGKVKLPPARPEWVVADLAHKKMLCQRCGVEEPAAFPDPGEPDVMGKLSGMLGTLKAFMDAHASCKETK